MLRDFVELHAAPVSFSCTILCFRGLVDWMHVHFVGSVDLLYLAHEINSIMIPFCDTSFHDPGAHMPDPGPLWYADPSDADDGAHLDTFNTWVFPYFFFLTGVCCDREFVIASQRK